TVAALVTGNTVVAKPAPQTPAIAQAAVELAYRAGVPRDALLLAVGGPEVGQALTEDHRIAGVAFTGSTATAKRIAKNADWIVANDVSGDVMGGDRNSVHLVTADGIDHWADAPKSDVAGRLADRIADALA
ncbi:hypothetical protein LTR94_030444, partial [Friedmanniomyces endolithicus]